MAPRRLIRPGGTRGIKHLQTPVCPYKGRFQFLLRWQWEIGLHAGTAENITRWLKNGRAA
jgi:hypothetical protein